MFQFGSCSPASFSILSAIHFSSMINLIRGVLRREIINKATGTNWIKNIMRFPEMHIYSIFLISMASPHIPPAESDSHEELKNPNKKFDSQNHPLKKLSGSCKVGLGIILGSPFDNILFGQQVKGDYNFPKPLDSSSSVETITSTSTEKVDEVPLSSSVAHEWPCVFAQNHGFPFTNSNGSQQLTICTKHRNAGFLSLEDIETTDNYTRIISYLPYPKVTHMYNYCILEFHQTQSFHGNFNKKNPVYPPRVHNLRRWSVLSSNENFLKNCETCDKPLKGRDIYIYRGESSFCSLECRYWKVKAEKDFEKVTRMVPMAPSSSNTKKAIFYVGAKPLAGA